MSTISKQRAKKAVILLLGVSSVATMGLAIAEQASADQNQNDHHDDITLKPQNDFISTGIEAIDTNRFEKELKENGLHKEAVLDQSENEPPNQAVSLEEGLSAIHNLNQYQKVSVIATGYTAGKESTGKDPSHPQYGITYSGVSVRRDTYSTIAADLNIFPLGTVLYIPGYGYGIVADTGSAIKGKKIDLYFETVDDVYEQWGKRKVDVYVVKRGTGRLTENLLNQYNHVANAGNSTL